MGLHLHLHGRPSPPLDLGPGPGHQATGRQGNLGGHPSIQGQGQRGMRWRGRRDHGLSPSLQLAMT
eukprot:scaffold106321_cov35-Tisochrysis_lutea.AAC.1